MSETPILAPQDNIGELEPTSDAWMDDELARRQAEAHVSLELQPEFIVRNIKHTGDVLAVIRNAELGNTMQNPFDRAA